MSPIVMDLSLLPRWRRRERALGKRGRGLLNRKVPAGVLGLEYSDAFFSDVPVRRWIPGSLSYQIFAGYDFPTAMLPGMMVLRIPYISSLWGGARPSQFS